jgi:hypothetical protein
MRWLVHISFGFFRYMKRTLFILILRASVEGLHAQTAPDLRIVSESSTSLVVEFTPKYVPRTIRSSDGKVYTKYEFLGAAIEPGSAGSPMIFYRPVLVNLPSRQHSVAILSQEYDDVFNANPAAMPTWQMNGGFGLSPTYGAVAAKYVSPDRLPAQAAAMTDIGESRGYLLGTLRLFPVQYSLARNEARLIRRMVVRIDFARPLQGVPASSFIQGRSPVGGAGEPQVSISKAAGDSPLAAGDWYRMELKETGIYKIDTEFLSKAGISSGAIGNINSIRVFGNGGEELPENLLAARPNGLEEVTRLVVDKNGNGTFDSDDFILFYGKSPRGWTYRPSEKSWDHYLNHYTETAVYFLTFGGTGRGRDMAALRSTTVTGGYAPTDFKSRLFVENEIYNLVKSGRQWLGEAFDLTRNVNVYTSALPGVVSSKPTVYQFQFCSRSTSIDTFRVQENNQAIGSPVLMYDVDVSSIVDQYYYSAPVTTIERTGALPSDRSVLRLSFGTRNNVAQGWLDWFEIFYPRRFEADSDVLLFPSPDTTAVVDYTISKFSSRDIYVFDISSHAHVRQVTNLAFDAADASIVRFQAAQAGGSVTEFAAVGPKGFKTASGVKKISNSNLHASTNGAEFIILAPVDFVAEANRLRAHRERIDQLKTIVVPVDQVYNEFSSGMLDPTAIRDFLKYTQTSWSQKPRYVLLFGAGSYDYKKTKFPSVDNWIPPYETFESNVQILTLATDDYFVIFDPATQRIGMAIGRLPVRTLSAATALVDKIISYETTAPFDSWRNRITFVADDGLTSTGDDGTIHTDQSERLAQVYTPDSFMKDKIFVVQYPTVSSSTGRRKPAVNEAIDQAINRGTVVLNYTGHGNTGQWAHEKVFSEDQDFSLISNKGKLFFLVAATCDFARYDNPEETSAGEELILMPGRGAIAAVTADRVVYSDQNALLNWTLYDNLFRQDAQGKPMRLGDAMWLTKQVLNTTNDLKHHLLGDPTMRLAVPRGRITIDSLNGNSTSSLVTVNALSKVLVRGNLRTQSGATAGSVQGRALMEVYDSKRKVLVPEWGNYTFETNGSLIYRGEVSIRNGAVQGTFPIPKDVSYGDDRSRVSLYGWGDSTDAIGYTENLAISGAAAGGIDTSGPVMRVYVEDQSFHPGDIVGPSATLVVDLTDSSGINTSTAGIGHKLEAILDNSPRVIDLTEYYRGNLDTYQTGQVRYPFLDLPEGRHSLTVKAWDVYNNSAQAETFFEVRAATETGIFNAVNVPNPFARSTTFTFQRSSTEPVDVEIKVYTVAGRLIQVLEAMALTDRVGRIPWDGRDRDGNEIANGVYLYRLIVRSMDGTATNEVIGRLAVLR